MCTHVKLCECFSFWFYAWPLLVFSYAWMRCSDGVSGSGLNRPVQSSLLPRRAAQSVLLTLKRMCDVYVVHTHTHTHTYINTQILPTIIHLWYENYVFVCNVCIIVSAACFSTCVRSSLFDDRRRRQRRRRLKDVRWIYKLCCGCCCFPAFLLQIDETHNVSYWVVYSIPNPTKNTKSLGCFLLFGVCKKTPPQRIVQLNFSHSRLGRQRTRGAVTLSNRDKDTRRERQLFVYLFILQLFTHIYIYVYLIFHSRFGFRSS